ncbi:hypothetical protein [Saliphagus sp. LR7]|uniref:hypothetical protein n=1 Tax=Saliphagus sp. LR7 TaxID=2282654 RepID=UPI000DF782C1|nr:hypothetical protein [Saliphagus sp. LR7]
MPDKLLECPSAGCTWTTRDVPEITAHINQNHPTEFQRDDWLTFSNPESAQFQSGIGREQTTGSDDEDAATDET